MGAGASAPGGNEEEEDQDDAPEEEEVRKRAERDFRKVPIARLPLALRTLQLSPPAGEMPKELLLPRLDS
jgi:hypothetical protein